MSIRTIIVLALALICGVGAAGGIFLLRKQPGGPAIETTPVIYAAVDIQRGETIKEQMIEVRQVPVDQVTSPVLGNSADVLERSAHMPMLKGDIILDAKLAPKGSGSGMASLIRPGFRAFTIQTPSLSSSLAGFLLPGNRVDVLFTVTSAGGLDDPAGGATTSTLLTNVEILAVHTTVDTPATNKIDPKDALSVTLLVKPAEAALLDLGQNKGTLHLSLRNPTDKEAPDAKPATMLDILTSLGDKKAAKKEVAVAPPPPPPVAPPPPLAPPAPVEISYSIRTLRGTSVGADQLTIRMPAANAGSRGGLAAIVAGDQLADRVGPPSPTSP